MERNISVTRSMSKETVHQTAVEDDRIKGPVESSSRQIQKLLNYGAQRLLARASDNRSLPRELLAPRISAAVDKYLLRDNPQTPEAEIAKFIDELQADDLCLIVACERGDENAWNDLVARFTTTVRSAARSASSNEDAERTVVVNRAT